VTGDVLRKGQTMKRLESSEKERYHRQMLIPGWGEPGQEKLKNATVFIAGAGGLGSPVAIYLAVAGVGTLRICDCGEPELSNLNRQILHDDTRIGKSKALSAQQTLCRLNPDITVVPLAERITDVTVAELVGDADILVDCLDNFDTRHVLNRYAVKKHLPMVHAGVYGMHGQLLFIHPPETPCLWCMHAGSVPAALFPIVGATAGAMGCLEALETLKYLTGIGTNLKGQMLLWDGSTMEFTKLELKKLPDCPVCGISGIGNRQGG